MIAKPSEFKAFSHSSAFENVTCTIGIGFFVPWYRIRLTDLYLYSTYIKSLMGSHFGQIGPRVTEVA